MPNHVLASAVPVFLALILAEWALTRKWERPAYGSFAAFAANMACGIGQALIEIFLAAAILLGYVALQEALGIDRLPVNILTTLVLFALHDLMFYVSHRAGHRFPLLWAVHSVHHQSRDFNFSVGLRLPWFHKVVNFWIYVPAALLGFDPLQLVSVASIQASLQLLSHTRLVRREIPFLRWIFVTPSHHRVHHGLNERYRDKNFAGVFSFWDRLFGTYVAETEEPVFGCDPQYPELDPVASNFAPLAALATKRSRTPAAPISRPPRSTLPRVLEFSLFTLIFSLFWAYAGSFALGSRIIGVVVLFLWLLVMIRRIRQNDSKPLSSI